MGYREVGVLEIKEVLRLWLSGRSKKAIARQLGIDPKSAIEACEAAWVFYGGIFRTLLPDNTSAIIHKADPLYPRIVDGFLEYAQARGFQIDPARVRHPKDKGRVERAVPHVRDDSLA